MWHIHHQPHRQAWTLHQQQKKRKSRRRELLKHTVLWDRALLSVALKAIFLLLSSFVNDEGLCLVTGKKKSTALSAGRYPIGFPRPSHSVNPPLLTGFLICSIAPPFFFPFVSHLFHFFIAYNCSHFLSFSLSITTLETWRTRLEDSVLSTPLLLL